MSRTPIPFQADDVSALSRSLTRQLSELDHVPGHVEMLNLLARATGFRNFQALRASHLAREQLAAPVPQPSQLDYTRIRQLRRYFDESGRLARWPGKFNHRQVCTWVVWSRLPARRTLSEKQINEAIQSTETIGDHVLLRRALVDCGLLSRTPDGGEYCRNERQPPEEMTVLLRHLATP